MKRLAVLVAFLVAVPLAAREFEAGVRHVIVTTGDTGELDVKLSRGFAATAELYFLSHRFSTELSATFVNPEAIFANEVDLGTLGLQTTALTGRWNLRPESHLTFFVGAGPALVTIGNLDDQFDDKVEIDFDSELTVVGEAGLRYRLPAAPRVALVVTVAYMPLEPEPNVRRSNIALPQRLGIDPMTFGIGATWRF
jgi:outer membrane protein W